MNEPLAYRNGELLPASQLSVAVYDAGFVLGATATEQLRTFRGELFRLREHLDRLARSLDLLGIELDVERAELAEVARRLAAHNHALMEEEDDLGLCIFVTPGAYAGFAPVDAPAGPTVCMHTYPLAFHTFAALYEQGQPLVIPTVRQVPPQCWPRELKCRSRVHYYLADREARRADPRARAILLDDEGELTEATTASLVLYFSGEGLVTPPRTNILPGISVGVVAELAAALGIPMGERPLRPADAALADEAMLAGTSPCLTPAVQIGGRPLGDGRPGPVYRRLLAAWSEMVGVDIAAQARQMAPRRRGGAGGGAGG